MVDDGRRDLERGPTGDHGQDGEDGARGEKGDRGARGAPGPRNRLAVVGFVILAVSVAAAFFITDRANDRRFCVNQRQVIERQLSASTFNTQTWRMFRENSSSPAVRAYFAGTIPGREKLLAAIHVQLENLPC